ncbi:MAG TPA: efflux RND transporter periplasmic adaptor subunit [Puia sp.]|jgi:membrane fusion protein (multidrug efflux system)
MNRSAFFWLPVVVLAASCGQQPDQAPPPPPSVPVKTVEAGEQTAYKIYPAAIEGVANVEIHSQITGILEHIFVDEGAFVKKGQPIFRIDQRPFVAELNKVKASEQSAEAAAANARLEVEKITPLVDNHVVAENQLRTAKSNLEQAVAGIEQAKASVAAAEIDLGYTVITAPASGYISRLNKKPGSIISPADPQPLTSLSDIRQVRVYFSLAEGDFIAFKNNYPGATLDEKLKHLPPVALLLPDDSLYAEPGHVDMIDGQFDKNTGTVTMRASFPNGEGMLRSGNTGKIRFSQSFSNTVSIPQASTVEIQDKIYVFIIGDSNKVRKQPIMVLASTGRDYLVNGGIKAGDRYVISGFEHLQDGATVQPVGAPVAPSGESTPSPKK